MFVSVFHLLGILVPYYIYLLTAPSSQSSEVLSKGIGLFNMWFMEINIATWVMLYVCM